MAEKSKQSDARRWPLWMRKASARLRDRSVLVPVCVLFTVVVFASVVGMVILVMTAKSPRSTRYRPLSTDPAEIDPALMAFAETAAMKIDDPPSIRGIAVDAEDRVYIAGSGSFVVYDREGDRLFKRALDGEPQCLAVADANHRYPGRIYVGLEDHVAVFDAAGEPVASWPPPAAGALITAVAVGPETVYLADARNKVVHRYDPDGEALPAIRGRSEEANGYTGFDVWLPYFDVEVAKDGLVHVVNPRKHRIEAFAQDGRWQASRTWGRPSAAIDGFCGCCNPNDFDVFPDGRFVTAEKSMLRVKIYSSRGQLLSVVAGPQQFKLSDGQAFVPDPLHPKRYVKVAVDSRGRVLVLDPAIGKVRVFEKKRKEV